MKNDLLFQRLLKILFLLSSSYGYSAQELAERFEISERQVSRYIEQMRNTGLIINLRNGRYYIAKESPQKKELEELLHFSKEEAHILQKAIHSIDDSTLLKAELVKKLYSIYDFGLSPEFIIRKENAEIVQLLMQAIENKRQIIVANYSSGNSQKTTNRLIEPFRITTNYTSVWAYEPESKMCKTFKIQRIGKITIIDKKWENENLHKENPVDAFHMSGKDEITVKLLLTTRAKNLLIEEYPLAEKNIKQTGENEFTYTGKVCSFDGIGRFVLSLADQIIVLQPNKFKHWLNDKVSKMKF